MLTIINMYTAHNYRLYLCSSTRTSTKNTSDNTVVGSLSQYKGLCCLYLLSGYHHFGVVLVPANLEYLGSII